MTDSLLLLHFNSLSTNRFDLMDWCRLNSKCSPAKKSVETIEQRDSSQSKPFKLISRAGKAIHNELAQLEMLLS